VRKKSVLGLAILILVSLIIPNANAFDVHIDMWPSKGTIETQIVLFVSTTPYKTSNSWRLYVFWDDYPVANAVPDVRVGKTNNWEHRWELNFYPPPFPEYARKGTYKIKIRVVNSTGHFKVITKYFDIRETIPIPSWVEDLSEEELAALQGPTGPEGPLGETGEQGLQGETGPQGVKGNKGEKGDRGKQGEPGPVGPIGPRGRSYPVLLFYIGLILSIASITLSVRTLRKYEFKVKR